MDSLRRLVRSPEGLRPALRAFGDLVARDAGDGLLLVAALDVQTLDGGFCSLWWTSRDPERFLVQESRGVQVQDRHRHGSLAGAREALVSLVGERHAVDVTLTWWSVDDAMFPTVREAATTVTAVVAAAVAAGDLVADKDKDADDVVMCVDITTAGGCVSWYPGGDDDPPEFVVEGRGGFTQAEALAALGALTPPEHPETRVRRSLLNRRRFETDEDRAGCAAAWTAFWDRSRWEFARLAWAPARHVDWCLDEADKRELAADKRELAADRRELTAA